MKTVNGALHISVDIECPACKEIINLLDHDQFHDDGYLYKEVLEGDEMGCKALGDEFKCPECHERFIIGDIEW